MPAREISPQRTPRTVTRRQLLTSAGLLVAGGLAACDAASDAPAPRPGSPTPSTPGVPSPSPTSAQDAQLRKAAAGRVTVLLDTYDDALRGRDGTDPARAPLLVLRADHAAHLQALTGQPPPPPPIDDPTAGPTVADPPGTSPAGQASAEPAPPDPAAPDQTAADQTAADPVPPAPVPVDVLLAAERLAEAGNAGDVGAASRPLARLLASIAACEASHEVGLGAVAPR